MIILKSVCVKMLALILSLLNHKVEGQAVAVAFASANGVTATASSSSTAGFGFGFPAQLNNFIPPLGGNLNGFRQPNLGLPLLPQPYLPGNGFANQGKLNNGVGNRFGQQQGFNRGNNNGNKNRPYINANNQAFKPPLRGNLNGFGQPNLGLPLAPQPYLPGNGFANQGNFNNGVGNQFGQQQGFNRGNNNGNKNRPNINANNQAFKPGLNQGNNGNRPNNSSGKRPNNSNNKNNFNNGNNGINGNNGNNKNKKPYQGPSNPQGNFNKNPQNMANRPNNNNKKPNQSQPSVVNKPKPIVTTVRPIPTTPKPKPTTTTARPRPTTTKARPTTTAKPRTTAKPITTQQLTVKPQIPAKPEDNNQNPPYNPSNPPLSQPINPTTINPVPSYPVNNDNLQTNNPQQPMWNIQSPNPDFPQNPNWNIQSPNTNVPSNNGFPSNSNGGYNNQGPVFQPLPPPNQGGLIVETGKNPLNAPPSLPIQLPPPTYSPVPVITSTTTRPYNNNPKGHIQPGTIVNPDSPYYIPKEDEEDPTLLIDIRRL